MSITHTNFSRKLDTARVPADQVETRPIEEIRREIIERDRDAIEAEWHRLYGGGESDRADAPSNPTDAEWAASGASLETIRRNVVTLDGQGAIEFILESDLEKYSSQFVTVPLRRVLDRYEPLENGGWAVRGLDPLNGWKPMAWGQLKPSTPRVDDRGKTIKYESPKNTPTRAIFLDSPGIDWAATQGDPSTPILITEGGKKSGCVQDQAGVPAIALPGITGAVKRGIGLIPEIAALCQPGRLFVLAFDSEPDTKPKTQQAIRREIKKLRREIRRRGCFLVVASWSPDEGKGIDDVWSNHGTERVRAIIADAIQRHADAMAATNAHKKRWQEQKALNRLNRWTKSQQFTPTLTINQKYVDLSDWSILAKTDILAIKSGMGTGKTAWLCRTLAGLDSGAVMIGSRNSLLLQTAERLGGFYHLHSDCAFPFTADPYSRIATCIDSLVHFADNHFDGKIIILDEWVSTLSHALQSGTLTGRRTECLAKLETAVRRASVVIALDGNNNDIAINHIIALRGGDCEVLKILNENQGNSKTIEIANPIHPQTGAPMVRSHAPVLQTLKTAADLFHLNPAPDRAIAIISDSQRLCEALDGVLTGMGLNGIRIDSKTIETPEIQAFLKSPNQAIADNRPDFVILSPTAESGIDISIKNYFGNGFAFFCGVLGTDSQTQFLNRFRHVSDWLVSCPTYTTLETNEGSRSPHAREIEQHLIEHAEIELKLILEGGDDIALEQARSALERKIQAVVNDQNTRTWAQLQAARNFERQNTRECLKIALEGQGNTVTIVDVIHGKSGLCDAISAERDAIIDRDSTLIFNAPDITLREAIAIKSRFGATIEDRNSAEKCILLARLPGIQDSDQWSVDLVKKLLFTDRPLLSRLERRWAVQHIDTAKNEAQQQWRAIAGGASLFLPDIRCDFARAFALKSLGLEQLFNGDWVTASSEIVQKIYTKIKRSNPLQTALGLTVGNQTPIQLIGKLVQMIGGTSVSERDGTGDRTRRYRYVSPEFDPLKNSILKSIQKRREKNLFSETDETHATLELDPVHPPQYADPIQGAGGRPKPHTPNAITPPPKNNDFWVGDLVRWGTSIATWTIASIEEAIATIHQVSGWAAAVPFTVPIGELEAIA